MNKVPPSNTEAEKIVLGGILLHKDFIFRALGSLTPEDFYSPTNEAIYTVMLELVEARKPVDITTVLDEFKNKNIKVQGLAGYLAGLMNIIVTQDLFDHFAEAIKQKRVLRDLIRVSSENVESAYKPDAEYEQVVEEAQAGMFALLQKQSLASMRPISEDAKHVEKRIETLQAHGGRLRGIPTGLTRLDDILSGLQKSDLIILGARPSLGKTALALGIARHASLQGVTVGLCSLEMSREQVADRVVSMQSHIPLWRLRSGKVDKEELDRLKPTLDQVAAMTLFVDDSPSPTVTQIRAMARRLQLERGLGLLVVDYLQLIQPRNLKDNPVHQVTEISRGLKAIARELDVPVLALSQLSRGVEQRTDPTPRLSDLRESGSIEQDADVVILIARSLKEQETKTKLLVAKHRNGPLGDIEVEFDAERAMFKEIDYQHIPGWDG